MKKRKLSEYKSFMGGNLFVLILFSFLSPLCGQENLIINGGFENGLSGWSSFWSRTPNAGSVEIVSDLYHSGGHAAFIEHHDPQDWSFAVNKRYAVKSGEIYEYSAWIKVVQAEWANLSVITFDKNQQVIEWSYAARDISTPRATFMLYSAQVVIPDDVQYINPRIIGGGECELTIDDVTLILKGTIGDEKSHALENDNLLIEITTPGASMMVKDKINQIVYQSAATNTLQMAVVDSTSTSLLLRGVYLPDNLTMTIQFILSQHHVEMHLQPDSAAEYINALDFPGTFSSKKNDYLVVPRGSGFIQPVTEDYPFWEFDMYSWKSTMSFIGVTDLHSGYMLVSDDPWDTRVEFPRRQSYVTPQLQHLPAKNRFTARRLYFVPIIQNGYLEMCHWYRNHVEELGYIVTWPEKIQDNEAVDRLRGAVDFWFLDDQMQTLAMIDSLHLYGLDRALISLSGSWYAPKDKGELIDYINENGYLSSRYDIYTDVWPPDHPETPWYRTEGYPQDVIVNQDGSLRKGWLAYLQGNVPFQGYYTCSQTHELYAEKWISEELASQPYNCRFIDVELASSLTECYSPVHPITRKNDAHYRTRLLQTVKSDFNLVTGSEEAHDWAFPTVDFGEGTMTMRPQDNAGYDWANPITNPELDYARYNIEPDVRLPLHGLVYHDVHVPTWYTGDGQSKVPQFWEDKDLWNILYASMPLFAPPDRGYWQKNKEKYLTSYFLACSVFRECGFEPMIDHQFIDGRHEVQMTEFANGWKVVANFSDAPIAWNEFMLAPKGCYAGNGRDVVYKIMNADNPTAVCCLADRLFINPFGQAFEGYGIRTTGSLVLQKKADRLELALIGNQKEFEINPQKLPWQMESVRIYTHDNAEIKPEVRTDGWLRIIKQKRMPFYQIKGIFTTVEESQLDHPREYRLAVYPNPLNGRSRIIFSAPTSAPVTLRLYNILGKEIETLFSGRLSAREQSLSLNSDGLATGIYFLDFAAADQRLTQKMMVIK